MITCTLLIIIAAICKACADVLADYPAQFRFKGKFWCKWRPDEVFIPFTKYPFTAWHLANSGMICAFIAVPMFASFNWVAYLAFGALFIATFNLFYNHFFKVHQ